VSFLIDTDICSAHLKQQGPVTNRFLQYTGRLFVSAVTVGELYTWALRANAPPQRLSALLDLFNDVTVLDVTEQVGRKFGEVRAALFDIGRPAPEMDLLIAATALVHNLTLITHNIRDFMNVPGLAVQDWLNP
jgi:predicted nucleic acid-binding protein